MQCFFRYGYFLHAFSLLWYKSTPHLVLSTHLTLQSCYSITIDTDHQGQIKQMVGDVCRALERFAAADLAGHLGFSTPPAGGNKNKFEDVTNMFMYKGARIPPVASYKCYICVVVGLHSCYCGTCNWLECRCPFQLLGVWTDSTGHASTVASLYFDRGLYWLIILIFSHASERLTGIRDQAQENRREEHVNTVPMTAPTTLPPHGADIGSPNHTEARLAHDQHTGGGGITNTDTTSSAWPAAPQVDSANVTGSEGAMGGVQRQYTVSAMV